MQRHDRVFRLLLGKLRCQALFVRFKRLELRPGNVHGHGLVLERSPQPRDGTFNLCQLVLDPPGIGRDVVMVQAQDHYVEVTPHAIRRLCL